MEVMLVDYGAGNLHSVLKALRHVRARATVTVSPEDILEAQCVVLPGVGAFADGMRGLEQRGLADAVRAYAASGRPLLGVCLGMQLLFDGSEEFDGARGLGLINGEVVALRSTPGVKVPHVGWNQVRPQHGPSFDDTPLAGLAPGAYFYFCHSYVGQPADPAAVLATARYGDVDVCAAVSQGNIWGTQFHPEKSGPVGLGVLRRFVAAARVATSVS